VNPQATLASTRLNDIVGAQNVICDAQTLSAYAVDGVIPKAAARTGTAQEISELVKFAAAENLALIPTGARSKLGIGMPPARYDLAIDMTRLDRVISYDPGDLTLSVEPGIPLARLAAILAEHNQFLPLDVPFFERATVGGTLASGVDSPLRHAYGTARDFVLGMEFVTGDGSLAKSGGRVVKNVTGYDLHKLMLGAIGSLGVITRVNFKTFPLPSNTATFVAAFASSDAAAKFNLVVHKSPLRCQAVEILSPTAVASMNANRVPGVFGGDSSNQFVAVVTVAGNDAVIARCERDLRSLAQSASGSRCEFTRIEDLQQKQLWAAIREFPATLQAQPEAAIIKVSCLPSDFGAFFDESAVAAKKHYTEIAHVFHGCGTCYCLLFSPQNSPSHLAACCKELLDRSARAARNASIFWCGPKLKREVNVWGPPREDFSLMQRVKQAFDPHSIFAPGRFVGGR
jgi:glycolate dehydrogenase FAD-binding subunit